MNMYDTTDVNTAEVAIELRKLFVSVWQLRNQHGNLEEFYVGMDDAILEFKQLHPERELITFPNKSLATLMKTVKLMQGDIMYYILNKVVPVVPVVSDDDDEHWNADWATDVISDSDE